LKRCPAIFRPLVSGVLRSFPFIKPCVPSRRREPPTGSSWLHEAKLDGWRGQMHKCHGVVRLYSKRGNDLGFRFPDLVRALASLPLREVILDGEITALDRQGLPNFEALQRSDDDYVQTFWAFDLLRVGNCDLRVLPLEDRRAKLVNLLSGTHSVHIRYSESFEDGQALLEAVIRLGLEGVVSKKRRSPYRSGPCRDWVKMKSAAWREANRERWRFFEVKG
jgi:bifunctional non-homologous end joining protein LigD